MHISVINANAYRSKERERMQANRTKRQANGLMRVFGLEPSFTPCLNPEGTHRERRITSRPQRYERRILRFFNGMINTFRTTS